MSDNILTTDRNSANIALAAKDVAGVLVPRNMLTDAAGADISPATAGKQDTANAALAALELALADPATETTLAALLAALGTPLQAGGTVVGPLTNTELRATPVPVSGTFWQATQPVSGTFWQATQPVSIASWGGLTDTQLRATPVPVSGTVGVSGSVAVTGTFWQATQPVSGTFWQATQPVSAASLPLPNGAAAETTLAAMSARLPAALGPKAGSASLSVVEALPTTTNFSVQTAATGASFVALASASCNVVRIVNAWPGAADIEVRRGGAGVTIPVPGGAERAFDGLTNANELEVRRIDQSNTQVTISCEKVVL